MIEIIRVVYLFALVIIAAYTDMAKDKVYNWLIIPSLILGPLFAWSLGGSPTPVVNTGFSDGAINQGGFNLLSSLGGMGLGAGIFLPFYLLRQVGGGDVKLMAAVGGLVGFPLILTIIFYAALVGAIMGIVVLIWHRIVKRYNVATLQRLSTIPFGLAIAVGTLWVYGLAIAR